jgi:hypothetical protein
VGAPVMNLIQPGLSGFQLVASPKFSKKATGMAAHAALLAILI